MTIFGLDWEEGPNCGQFVGEYSDHLISVEPACDEHGRWHCRWEVRRQWDGVVASGWEDRGLEHAARLVMRVVDALLMGDDE